MDKDAFEEFLNRRYHSTLLQYKNRAFRNQQFYKNLQWITICLSVIAAMFIGIEQFYGLIINKISSLITSVVVLGLTMALKTFSYQEKWVLYNKMSIELENEFSMYQFGGGAYSKQADKERFFVSRIIAILNESTVGIQHATIPRPPIITNVIETSMRKIERIMNLEQ